MPTELLTDREWLPGELLSGSECLKAWLVLKYEISDLFLGGESKTMKEGQWIYHGVLNFSPNES